MSVQSRLSSKSNNRKPVILAALATLAGLSSFYAESAMADTVTKANNTSDLNLTGSWVGGVVPASVDVALWNSTVTGANSVVLGGNLSLAGITIVDPAGAVTIGAGNTLTLAGSGINMSAATQDLTISSGLSLGQGGQTWNVASGRTLTLNTGAFARSAGAALNIQGAGNVAASMTGIANTNNIIGPWASVGTGTSTRYATLSAGSLVGFTGATASAGFNWTSSNNNTFNYDVSAVTGAIGVNRVGNTARYTAAAGTQNLGSSNTTTLTLNGLMNAGTGLLTFSEAGGTSQGQIAIGTNNGNELVFSAANANITLNIPVINTGANAGSILITGPNTVNINSSGGISTYTGQTTVASGILSVTGAGNINSTSGITVNGPSAKYLHTSSVASTRTITLTNGTVDGTGTLGTINIADNSGAVIANGNGGTGALTLGALSFGGDAVANLRFVAGGVPVTLTGTLATAPANGTVVVNATLASGSWTTGTNNLISYGSYGGLASAFSLGTVTGLGPRQAAGGIVLNGSNIALQVNGDAPKWTGGISSEWSTATLASPKNWKLATAGTETDFIQADDVLFDDTATGSTTVDITGSMVTTSSVNFNNSSKNYTIQSTGGFGIAGVGALTKNGTGTVNIATSNTYTGTTGIVGGSLVVDGSLNNTAITVGTGATLGFSGSGTTNGGSININGTAIVAGSLGNTPVSLNTGGSLTLTSASAIKLSTLTMNGGTLNQTVNDAISGSAAILAKTNITLSVPNSYTGDTFVNSGTGITVTITDPAAAGSGKLAGVTGATAPIFNLHMDGAGSNGVITTANGVGGNSGVNLTFDVNNNGSGNTGNKIVLGGTSLWGNSTMTITGGSGYSLEVAGITNSAGAAGSMAFAPTSANIRIGGVASSSGSAKTLVLDGTTTGNEIFGGITAASGTYAVTKSNTSTWTLLSSGASTYTGVTSITGGTLVAGATNALSTTSAVSVTGGKLDVSGFVNTVPTLTVGAGGTLAVGIGNTLAVTSAANLNGALNISGTTANPKEILMTYATRTGTFATVTGIPAGYLVSYRPLELDIVLPSTTDYYFTGSQGNGTWDSGVTTNFTTDHVNPVAFADYSNLTFNDTTGNGGDNQGQFSINVDSNGGLANNLTITGSTDYTFNGGAISTVGNLTKSGSGKATLLNPVLVAGTATISGGSTLSIGNGGTTGSLQASSIVMNGTLEINRSDNITLSGPISGPSTGTLVKNGANALTIANTSTFVGSGNILVNSGTIFMVPNALGDTVGNTTLAGGQLYLTSNNNFGAEPLVLQGGTLRSGGATTITWSGPVSVTSASNFSMDGGSTLQVAGTISSSNGSTVSTVGGGTLAILGDVAMGTGVLNYNTNAIRFTPATSSTISSAIAGTGAVNFTGGGTVNMTGSSTFSASVSIGTNTTVTATSLNSVVGGSATSALGAPLSAAAGQINLGGGGGSGRLMYVGTGETSDRVINLAGGLANSFVGIVEQAGTGTLNLTGGVISTSAAAHTLTLQGSTAGVGVISGAIVDNSPAAPTSVTKSGTGLWLLTGANTYTGPTTVNDGTLEVGVLRSASPVVVNGGTLAVTPSDGDGAGPGIRGAATSVGHVTSLTIGAAGKLDLKNNGLIIPATGSLNGSTISVDTLRAAIIAGRGGVGTGAATWSGAGGIGTSVFAFDETFDSIGYCWTGDPNLLVGPTDINGESYSAGDYVVKYCAGADADLNGLVDDTDVAVIGLTYDAGASTGHHWYEGDFNYDGLINDDDVAIIGLAYNPSATPLSPSFYAALSAEYGASFASAFAAGASTVVPEPTTLGLLAVGAMGLLRRRRK